jgi:hypothetical protein
MVISFTLITCPGSRIEFWKLWFLCSLWMQFLRAILCWFECPKTFFFYFFCWINHHIKHLGKNGHVSILIGKDIGDDSICYSKQQTWTYRWIFQKKVGSKQTSLFIQIVFIIFFRQLDWLLMNAEKTLHHLLPQTNLGLLLVFWVFQWFVFTFSHSHPIFSAHSSCCFLLLTQKSRYFSLFYRLNFCRVLCTCCHCLCFVLVLACV